MVAVVGGVASSFESWLSFDDCDEDDDDGIGDIVGDDGNYGEKKRKIGGMKMFILMILGSFPTKF